MTRSRRIGLTLTSVLQWGALVVTLLVGALFAHLQWRGHASSESQDRHWHESIAVPAATPSPTLVGAADRSASEPRAAPPPRDPDAARTLAVRVLDASDDETPIPGAEVGLLEASHAVGLLGLYLDCVTLASGRTDSAGRLELKTPENRRDQELLVQARAPGRVGHVQFLGTGPETPQEIEIKLEPGLGLSGTVLTASGDVVPGVSVSARRLGWPRRTTHRLPEDLGHWACKSTTNGRGVFSFDGLDDAYYDIRVDDPEWVHLIRSRSPGEPLKEVLTVFKAGTADRIQMEVERLRYYRARFVDDATGVGIPTADEVMVSGLVPHSAYRNVEPAELVGRVEGFRLGPQRHDPALWVGAVALPSSDTPELADLAFTVPGYTYGASRVHLLSPTEIAGAGAVDEVRLESQSDEFGSLLVDARLPAGVRLPATPPALAVFLKNGIVMFASGVERETGAWSYTSIPVTATEVALRDCHWIRFPVEVKRGVQTQLTADFTSASGIVISLESEDGGPLFDAELFLVEEDTGFSIRVPSKVAAFALGAGGKPARVPFFVDAGRYKLEAWLRGYRKAEAEVTVPADALADVKLKLEREK